MAAHLFPVIFILVTVYHCACVNSALADGGVADEDRKRGKNNLSNDRGDSGVFHDLGREHSESLDSLNSTLTPDRVTNVSANLSEDGNDSIAVTQKEKPRKKVKGQNIKQTTDKNVKPKRKNATTTTGKNVKNRDKKKPPKEPVEERKEITDITRRLRSLYTKPKKIECPCDDWDPRIKWTSDPSRQMVSVDFCDEKRKAIDDVKVRLYRQNENTRSILNDTLLETPSCQINFTGLEKGDYVIELRGECLGCELVNGYQHPTPLMEFGKFTVNECPCDDWKPHINWTLDTSGQMVSVDFCDEKRKAIDGVIVRLYRRNENTRSMLNVTILETPSCQINFTGLQKGDYVIELRGECLGCELVNGYQHATPLMQFGKFTVNETEDQTILRPLPVLEEKDGISSTILVGVLGAVLAVVVIVITVLAYKLCKRKESTSSSGTRSPDEQSFTESLMGHAEVSDCCTPNVPDDSRGLNVQNDSADSLAQCDSCDIMCERDHADSRQADHTVTPVSSRHVAHGIETGQRSLTDTGLAVHNLMQLPRTTTHDQSLDGKVPVEQELKVFRCTDPSLNGSCITLNVADLCGNSTSGCSPDGTSDKNQSLTQSSSTYNAPGSRMYDAPGSSTYYAPGSRMYDAPGSSTYYAPGSSTYNAPGRRMYDAHESSKYNAPGRCTNDAPRSSSYGENDSMLGERFEDYIIRDMNQPKFGILRQPNDMNQPKFGILRQPNDMNQPKFGILRQPNAQVKNTFSVSLPYRLLGLNQFDTNC
ncbi:uncharacterized protein LOC131938270 isoform X2 [Physella acuta]|uniref:uncharacterized protein LOC131938270 isoform X2 n=1 Tax=Physella acuta TaxID=109671 RepID=UPI0027DBA613|nr:uncharacterized protein LOC131938270 isoform X2 [Physella acuta]